MPFAAPRDTTTLAQLAQVARSAPSFADRQEFVETERELAAAEEEERRLKEGFPNVDPADHGYTLGDEEDAALSSLDFQGRRDATDEEAGVLLGVFNKPFAFVIGHDPKTGTPILDSAVQFCAEASRLVGKRRAVDLHLHVFVCLMRLHVFLTRCRAKLRAKCQAEGRAPPSVMHGPAFPVTVAFTANRVAAREGGENDGDREGRLTATETDLLDRGGGEARRDLNLKDVANPTVDGRGALDLYNLKCAFQCEGCRGHGYDVQTLAELSEQVERSASASCGPALAKRRGYRAVNEVVKLVQAGDQASAIGQRVVCRGWRCMVASGILREEDRAKWLAGKQYVNFSNGNKRHHSRDLFIANVSLLRQMWLDEELADKDDVASAVLDVSQTTFWAEARQREFFGVALVLAKRAQDIGYPLHGREAKQAYLTRMGQVPSNFINTVVLEHVLSDAYPEDMLARNPNAAAPRGGRVAGRRSTTGKPWSTVLTDMLKQNFPDANTTAHADMLHQNWLLAGKPVDEHGNPKHQVSLVHLMGGVRDGLFDGAVGYDSVVGPYLTQAHDQKTKLLFASAASNNDCDGGDVHAAIAANAKCCGFKTIGQKVAFERLVNMNPNRRERTTALVPSAGRTLRSPHAPADNALRAANNCDVWLKTVAALRCLNVEAPSVFAASFLAVHSGLRNAGGHTILPAARVFDARDTKSLPAIQRSEVFARNAAAGFGTPLGSARPRRIEAMLGLDPTRGRVSGVGLCVDDPTRNAAERLRLLGATSAPAAAFVEERRRACEAQLRNDLHRLRLEIRSVETPTEARICDRLVRYVEVGLPTTGSYACNAKGLGWDELDPPAAHAARSRELSEAHHQLNAFAAAGGALRALDTPQVRELVRCCELVLEARAWIGLPFNEPALGLTRRYTANMQRFMAGVVSAHKRADAPLPDTISKDVVRVTPLATHWVDAQALANVKANYQQLVDDQVLDPERFTFEAYTRCDAAQFWKMAEIKKTYKRKVWWALTQQPGNRWRCETPICLQRHSVWSTRLGDHTCKCTGTDDEATANCSFATYLSLHRIDGKQLWPTIALERDRFCRQLVIRSQANVDRLARIARRTADDRVKLAKARAELEAPTLTDRQRDDLLKKISTSKGKCSQEKHARAVVEHEHELPLVISRFCRGIDDEETRPLADAFDLEIERMTGTAAQRGARQLAFSTGNDKSVYYGGSSRLAAEARAEIAGMLGGRGRGRGDNTTAASQLVGDDDDSDDSDDSDDDDSARDQRRGARLQKQSLRRRAEVDTDERLSRGMADSDDDEPHRRRESTFVLAADEPLDAVARQALLDATPRAPLAKSKAAVEEESSAAGPNNNKRARISARVKGQLRRRLVVRTTKSSAADASAAAARAPSKKKKRTVAPITIEEAAAARWTYDGEDAARAPNNKKARVAPICFEEAAAARWTYDGEDNGEDEQDELWTDDEELDELWTVDN